MEIYQYINKTKVINKNRRNDFSILNNTSILHKQQLR